MLFTLNKETRPFFMLIALITQTSLDSLAIIPIGHVNSSEDCAWAGQQLAPSTLLGRNVV